MGRETSVTVDRDFARFGSKSFAVNKINTVDVRYRYPYGSAAAVICGMLALFLGVAALGSLGAGGTAAAAVISAVLSALFGYLAYRAWQRSKIKEYQLFLMTSSSEAQALTSRDVDFIYQLRERIELAMAGKLA